MENLGIFERTEAFLGRSSWTVADYRAAGEAEFDKYHVESNSPWEPNDRNIYANGYVALNCPPAKLRAARAAIAKATGEPK